VHPDIRLLDLALLKTSMLLDPQSGEHLAVELTPLPSGKLAVAGGEVPVDRYALRAPGVDITLSYESRTGDWIGLDSAVERGRTLRYRRNLVDLNR